MGTHLNLHELDGGVVLAQGVNDRLRVLGVVALPEELGVGTVAGQGRAEVFQIAGAGEGGDLSQALRIRVAGEEGEQRSRVDGLEHLEMSLRFADFLGVKIMEEIGRGHTAVVGRCDATNNRGVSCSKTGKRVYHCTIMA